MTAYYLMRPNETSTVVIKVGEDKCTIVTLAQTEINVRVTSFAVAEWILNRFSRNEITEDEWMRILNDALHFIENRMGGYP